MSQSSPFNLILVSLSYMRDAGHLFLLLKSRFQTPMSFVFAQVVAVLLTLQLVSCSQAAGVLRNATIDHQDSRSRYSSGWGVANSDNATCGTYAFANTFAESIEIELPGKITASFFLCLMTDLFAANVTSLYFLGYNGHAKFAACLDCNDAVERQLVVVRESGQPALNLDSPVSPGFHYENSEF